MASKKKAVKTKSPAAAAKKLAKPAKSRKRWYDVTWEVRINEISVDGTSHVGEPSVHRCGIEVLAASPHAAAAVCDDRLRRLANIDLLDDLVD